MRSAIFRVVFISILLAGLPAFGQDLGKLRQRVSKLWELRQQPNKKFEALALIEPQSKELFLHWDEPVIVDFKISSFEPTEDDSRLDVVMKTHISTVQGVLDRTVKETWLWIDGDWFLKVTPLVMPFFQPDAGVLEEGPRPPEFHLISETVEAGRHAQGEILSGRIGFRGNRDQIRLITLGQYIAGFALRQPSWTSPSEGYIPYTWETTLLSHDVQQAITLDIVGINDARTRADVQFLVGIDGKVAFKQIPEIVDPMEAGEFELEIENLSRKPLRILSVISNNPAYRIRNERATDVPDTIQPGQSGRLHISSVAQETPSGASLDLMLSETLTASPLIRVPLHVKLPKESVTPLITEEMRRLGEEENKKSQSAKPVR